MTDANQQDPKSEKTEEKPEPLRYSVIEPSTRTSQGAPAQAGQPDASGVEAEEKPAGPRYSIIEPGTGPAKSAPTPDSQQDATGENTEEKPEPLRYSIIEQPPEVPKPGDFAQFDLRIPTNPLPAGDANNQTPGAAPAFGRPAGIGTPSAQIPKTPMSPARKIILAGVGLGILFGCVVAGVSWRFSAPTGPSDLGEAASTGYGLKGHLYTKWDKKLEYRLTIEPNDPSQQAGFAFAVAHPPRPLSIEIHLQDTQGFVLCSRDILLKYDGASAPAAAAPNPDAPAGKADTADSAANPPTQGMKDLSAAQEAEREAGKEVFKSELGPNGQVASLSAQGEIPCTEQAFADTSKWSLTPNFPSLAEQDELRRPRAAQASADEASSDASPVRARKKAPVVAAPKIVAFSIEGDDEIVDFDAYRGVIETRNGKTFYFDRTTGDTANPRWLDFPVNVHYRCDQTATCVLTRTGVGTLHAKLKR
jgi:hypothetical protein